MKIRLFLMAVLAGMILSAATAHAYVATFDDLTLETGSYWNGEDLTGYGSFGGFTSGNHYFVNYRTDYPGWEYWDGFAYTNMTDTITMGTDNQFSAITGGGVNGSDNYTVAYTFGMSGQKAQSYNATSQDGEARMIEGAYVTNTTYAFLSMLNGDGFGKAFGGDEGTDPDWFKLTFYGLDENGDHTGSSVDFYLADFRFENSAEDYILDEWVWVNLSGLGLVYGVEFILSSSDDDGSGAYGMRTPAYFAMDDFTSSPVPVPGTFLLLGCSMTFLVGCRRRLGE